MKQLLLPLLLLSSLVFLSASMAARAAASDAILDVDGNELKRDTEYYILQSPGIGGGLSLAPRNETCPLYVAKGSSEVDLGIPVRFYPVDPEQETVTVSQDANFVFSAFTICVQSGVWQLSPPDDAEHLYVGISGTVGNPGKDTLSNWFSIHKLDDGSNNYKLVFCPVVCNFCKPVCGDLGLFVEDGNAYLGLGVGGSPFSVAFQKA